MKKLLCGFIIYFLVLFCSLGLDVKADSDDYLCFVEIMMSSGKLMKDFTEEEINSYVAESIKSYDENYEIMQFYYANQNVYASYISSTLYNFNNKGSTDLNYEITVSLETSNKVTYKFGETLSASSSGNIKKLKVDLSSKTTTEYSNVTENSKKTTEKIKINVEANSRCVIYLFGDISITNGIYSRIMFDEVLEVVPFEMAIIQSQYPKIEKEKI